jgi:hypothetical protein
MASHHGNASKFTMFSDTSEAAPTPTGVSHLISMMTLIVLIFLIGAMLGLRFKVLILFPAMALALIAVLAGGMTGGDSLSAILIAAVLAASCLQVGYLCGVLARYRIAPALPGRRRASLDAHFAP